MGIEQTVKNKITCDREGCGTEVEYNPKPGPGEQLPKRIGEFVAVEHPLSGHRRLYCSDKCAVEDIGEGRHLPQAPSVLTPSATDADVRKVAAQAQIAKGSVQLS